VSQEDRAKLLGQLRLPITTGPVEWWLTEFEDPWPYRAAPADVTFARDPDQGAVKREPVVQYVAAPARPDGGVFLFAAALALAPLLARLRRWQA
jgi:hypothetical protein